MCQHYVVNDGGIIPPQWSIDNQYYGSNSLPSTNFHYNPNTSVLTATDIDPGRNNSQYWCRLLLFVGNNLICKYLSVNNLIIRKTGKIIKLPM